MSREPTVRGPQPADNVQRGSGSTGQCFAANAPNPRRRVLEDGSACCTPARLHWNPNGLISSNQCPLCTAHVAACSDEAFCCFTPPTDHGRGLSRGPRNGPTPAHARADAAGRAGSKGLFSKAGDVFSQRGRKPGHPSLRCLQGAGWCPPCTLRLRRLPCPVSPGTWWSSRCGGCF